MKLIFKIRRYDDTMIRGVGHIKLIFKIQRYEDTSMAYGDYVIIAKGIGESIQDINIQRNKLEV